MRPISITKNQRTGGIFLLIMFFTVVFAVLLTYPKYNDWQEKNQQVKDAQAQLDKIKADSATALQSIASISTPNFQNVDIAIPTESSLGDLYAHIESLAKAAAVNLNSVQAVADDASATQPTPASNLSGDKVAALIPTAPLPAGLNVVSLNIEVNGPYDNVHQFLKSLYTSLRIINIQNLALGGAASSAANGAVSAGGPGSQVLIDAKIQAQAYYSTKL